MIHQYFLNTMDADALLMPYVARPSAAMVMTMQGKRSWSSTKQDFYSSDAGVEIFQLWKLKTMLADALAPKVARASAGRVMAV